MWRTYRSCAACKNIKKARKIANPYKADSQRRQRQGLVASAEQQQRR